MAKAKNSALNAASKAKEDEFYTKIADIEKELRHYKNHFRDKVVFCNCDDPESSNFWKYFHMNFYHLGLKKLVSTHFEADKPSYKLEIIATNSNEGQLSLPEVKTTPLRENGDFRSPECISILDEADIVVTNPPFSLFREYVTLLLDHNKQFLIIGSQNNITYREIFPLLKDNKLWLGYNSGDMEFVVPDYYEPRATRYREENGIKYRSMGNICWFTNLDIEKRHESILLYQSYSKEEYPTYINYDGIEVNKIANIPADYYEPMGVPITFFDKYNPDQFEVLGIDGGDMGVSYGVGKDLTQDECTNLFREHKGFRRGKLCYRDNNNKIQVCYRRILIKRKKQL